MHPFFRALQKLNRLPGGGVMGKSAATIWSSLLAITAVINLSVIPADLGLTTSEYAGRIIWMRVFASMVLGAASVLPLFAAELWRKLYPALLASIALMITATLATIESFSEETHYHMGVMQVMFAIAIAPARLTSSILNLAIPVGTYYLVAGPTHFGEATVELFLFLTLGVAINRVAYRAFEDRLVDTRSTAITDAVAKSSHEIKHPLVTIQFAAEALAAGAADLSTDEIKSGLREIIEVSRRGLAVQRRIMLNARGATPDDAESKSHPQINVGDLISDSIRTFPFESEKDRQIVNVTIDEDRVFSGDYLLLSNVFHNLIENAIRSLRNSRVSDPQIRIRAAASGVFADILFEDNGKGFPPDQAEEIFRHGTSFNRSTGIGLAFCRETIERHGGTIVAESGDWTSFRILIPAAPIE